MSNLLQLWDLAGLLDEPQCSNIRERIEQEWRTYAQAYQAPIRTA